MVIEDNHTRLIHAANTASLAGFSGNYMADIMTENEGNVKGNREIRIDGFIDNEIIAQLNDEVENVNMNYLDNNDNDDNDDNDDNNYYDDDNNNGDDERSGGQREK